MRMTRTHTTQYDAKNGGHGGGAESRVSAANPGSTWGQIQYI